MRDGCLSVCRNGLEDNHAGTQLFGSGPRDGDSYPQCLLQQVSVKHTYTTHLKVRILSQILRRQIWVLREMQI